MENKEPILVVKDLKQHFKINRNFTVKAVDGISFDIMPGETYGLVGESGSGKSTTGRSIIRLYKPTSGSIVFNGKEIGGKLDKETSKELHTKMQMIFQDPMACLNPRKKVIDIIGQGLDIHKSYSSIEERNEKIYEMLELVGLSREHASRYPHQFSGGQRQRVAMGRAIVRNPKVFLMDEPLSNLDAKLRGQMRIEISKLHQRLGTTIIYVTHDQTEAMTLGTRIVVLKDGVIMQVDSPQKLYNQPNNLFVAGFIGSPQMNFVDAQCVVEGAKAFLKFDKYQVELPEAKAKKLIDGGYAGKNVVFGIRPEDIYDSAEHLDKFASCKIDSDVTGYELLGAEVLLYFTVAGANMSARVDSDTPARYGDHIELAFDPHKIHVFDKETELTITN